MYDDDGVMKWDFLALHGFCHTLCSLNFYRLPRLACNNFEYSILDYAYKHVKFKILFLHQLLKQLKIIGQHFKNNITQCATSMVYLTNFENVTIVCKLCFKEIWQWLNLIPYFLRLILWRYVSDNDTIPKFTLLM